MATEKRLIDANAYVDELKWLQEQVSSVSAIEIQEYIDRTNRQPTVDAVEVVRCKDCRFRKSTFNGDGYFCSVWDTDDYEEAYVKDNDFCSYGERRF